MEGGYSRMHAEVHLQLLDLIPQEGTWGFKKDDDHNIEGSRSSHSHGRVADDNKLELRLGPPGVEDWTLLNSPGNHKSPTKTAVPVPHSYQKRSAPAPVVGWPPIRSFRKNISSSSSAKPTPPPVSSNVVVPDGNNVVKMVESCHQGLFVKVNMDGVPIGRKVDLRAYDSYEKLSIAVHQLFRGLLAAQRDSNQEEDKGIKEEGGEYTLVYEDNEGDRMLVGDVPWHMFVSAAKRLHVVKSSELSRRCWSNQEKIQD